MTLLRSIPLIYVTCPSDVPIFPLSPGARHNCLAVFSEGLQAIEWTVDERGLAGLCELAGLSWRLDMETFFEGWVEMLADQIGRFRLTRMIEVPAQLEVQPEGG